MRRHLLPIVCVLVCGLSLGAVAEEEAQIHDVLPVQPAFTLPPSGEMETEVEKELRRRLVLLQELSDTLGTISTSRNSCAPCSTESSTSSRPNAG